jgi:uncharacterized protein
MVSEGERVAALLGLEPLPDEGGLFRRTHIDAHSSAIYFLLIAPDFSAMHRLTATETYHWYAGSPLRLLLLGDDGPVSEPVLGPDLTAGQRPQIVVPAGTWQGSSSTGEWSLVGTTTAPPDQRHSHGGDGCRVESSVSFFADGTDDGGREFGLFPVDEVPRAVGDAVHGGEALDPLPLLLLPDLIDLG